MTEEDYDCLMWGDIIRFHEKFGLEYDGPSKMLPEELDKFRTEFMHEELDEYITATTLEDKVDALVDLVVVAMGTAYLHGFDWPSHWDEVMYKNMEKIRAKSANESKRGTSFDIVKPEGWTPPEHTKHLK